MDSTDKCSSWECDYEKTLNVSQVLSLVVLEQLTLQSNETSSPDYQDLAK